MRFHEICKPYHFPRGRFSVQELASSTAATTALRQERPGACGRPVTGILTTSQPPNTSRSNWFSVRDNDVFDQCVGVRCMRAHIQPYSLRASSRRPCRAHTSIHLIHHTRIHPIHHTSPYTPPQSSSHCRPARVSIFGGTYDLSKPKTVHRCSNLLALQAVLRLRGFPRRAPASQPSCSNIWLKRDG